MTFCPNIPKYLWYSTIYKRQEVWKPVINQTLFQNEFKHINFFLLSSCFLVFSQLYLDKTAQKLTENDPTVFQNDIQFKPFTPKSRLVTSLAMCQVPGRKTQPKLTWSLQDTPSQAWAVFYSHCVFSEDYRLLGLFPSSLGASEPWQTSPTMCYIRPATRSHSNALGGCKL